MKFWFNSKKKYSLFNINNYKIDTSKFKHMLHDLEDELSEKFANYVGAKYACVANSASSLIELSLMYVAKEVPKKELIKKPIIIPSMIPVVVSNVIHNCGMPAYWKDDVDWVGNAYPLYENISPSRQAKKNSSKFKIIDSAQEVSRNQFKDTANDDDLMIFSLYPTKPVGGMDGGIMVSNDKRKIDYFKAAVHLGVGEVNNSSWQRTLLFPGWKTHPNSAQCYVALKNLEKLDKKNERLDDIREKYNDAMNIKNTSNHLYRINVDNRKKFRDIMKENNIETGMHYGAAHLYPFYRMKKSQGLEGTEATSKTTVSIPFNEKLSDKDVDFIIKKIKEFK